MKPEWGPPFRLMAVKKMNDEANGEMSISPVAVCRFDEGKGWSIWGENLRLLKPELTPDRLRELLG